MLNFARNKKKKSFIMKLHKIITVELENKWLKWKKIARFRHRKKHLINRKEILTKKKDLRRLKRTLRSCFNKKLRSERLRSSKKNKMNCLKKKGRRNRCRKFCHHNINLNYTLRAPMPKNNSDKKLKIESRNKCWIQSGIKPRPWIKKAFSVQNCKEMSSREMLKIFRNISELKQQLDKRNWLPRNRFHKL